MKRTLLISSACPGEGNVGGIFIRDMLSCEGIDPVSLAALDHHDGDASDSRKLRTFVSPKEHAERWRDGWRGTAGAMWGRWKRYAPAIRQLAGDIKAFVREDRPEQVWAILSSTASIDVVARLLPTLNCPLLVQVWDDPLHLLRQRRLDRLTQKRTLRRFDDILHRADRIAVISKQMADAYRGRASRPCVIVRHGVDDDVLPNDEPTGQDEFRIGFSGGMYCHSAWKALQQALDRLRWTICGKQVVLIATGSNIQFQAKRPTQARFLGWQPLDEVPRILSDCDLLYLPQPFDPIQEPLARLSFPTKLSTYVSTGRPILIHTPAYGSLVPFCDEYDLGLVCKQLDPLAVAGCLQQLESQPGHYQQLAEASARVASTVLSRSTFENQVRLFLRGEAAPDRDSVHAITLDEPLTVS